MKSMALLSAAASLGFAQTFNIRGTVKDVAGAAIAGVVVKLEKTGHQATSGSDGSFAITGTPDGIAAPDGGMPAPGLSAFLGGGSLFIRVSQRSPVTITTVGLDGKTVATMRPTLEAGTHAIALPNRGAGIFLHEIRAGGSGLVVGSLSMGRGTGGNAAFEQGASIPALAKPAGAGFSDVIAATKAGYLKYRVTVASPTASGLELKMIASAGSVTDADGNEYQSVKLGNQVWTVEHLRTTKFNDGTAIPLISDRTAWAGRTTSAYCYPNNATSPDSIRKWGALYNWYTVDSKKLAPAGWRVPNDADWMALQNYLISAGFNYDGTTTGNKIGKAMASMTDWAGSTVAGAVGNDQSKNNRSGFGAMPIGFRDQGGSFTSMGTRSIMSSSNNKEGLYGWFADIDNASSTLRYSDDWMRMGFAIRLIKN